MSVDIEVFFLSSTDDPLTTPLKRKMIKLENWYAQITQNAAQKDKK